jgi:hypothetical protein
MDYIQEMNHNHNHYNNFLNLKFDNSFPEMLAQHTLGREYCRRKSIAKDQLEKGIGLKFILTLKNGIKSIYYETVFY